MIAVISPSVANGTVAAPPSKSMAHRMLICAALARGESVIHGAALSEDISATIDCLTALGASISLDGSDIRVTGISPDDMCDKNHIKCRESGSTLRFLIPICLMDGKTRQLSGSKRLMERPMGIYEDICRERGFVFEKNAEGIALSGRLMPGKYIVPGDVSSQFITGLMLALPLTGGECKIELIPPVESRPYIDMTMSAMGMFGVNWVWTGKNELSLIKGAGYLPADVTVEGDYSNAAFLAAFNLIGGDVRVTGLSEKSLQGDRHYIEHFARLNEGFAEIDISDCPDLGPILFAMAALKNGGRFTGIRRLRLKESDRVAAMCEELFKFGIPSRAEENVLTVGHGENAPYSELNGHNDHRIVMSLAVLASCVGGRIAGAEAVSKSFPDFFGKLRDLNVNVRLV